MVMFKICSFLIHERKYTYVTPITVTSPHLNKRMPVGNRFSGICQHFTPVIPTEVVCIVANSTDTNDLIMAYTIGVGGREKKERDHHQLCIPKFMMHCILSSERKNKLKLSNYLCDSQSLKNHYNVL